MCPEEDADAKLKILEKENKLLKKRLERSEQEREGLEVHLERMRKLLETVAQEKLTEEIQKQLTLFRKFVPEEFLQNLNKENWIDVKLGDHVEREMTIMFSDIRSFTSISEKMSIQDNFEFINSFLYHVSPSIQAQRGFVDKYIGDAVMALFNHTEDAIEAGIGMHKSLLQYNVERQQRGALPIHMGIGLHSGNLMLGVIGVENRMQSTVISDAVNLASRLESLTKYYGSSLLVSQNVLLANKETYPTRFLGKIKVVGKTQTIEIYEILSAEPDEISEKKNASKSFFEEGLQLYFNKKFAEASVAFTQSLKAFPNDKAALHYLQESAHYMLTGVPEEWDGTDTLLQK
jgi:two-component system sensor histidine kinase ChiS